jgi:hypothetical protein
MAIVSDVPNCSITHDNYRAISHNHNMYILQATNLVDTAMLLNIGENIL